MRKQTIEQEWLDRMKAEGKAVVCHNDYIKLHQLKSALWIALSASDLHSALGQKVRAIYEEVCQKCEKTVSMRDIMGKKSAPDAIPANVIQFPFDAKN